MHRSKSMHEIFILYTGMYIFCCLLEHSIVAGYITVIDNKWLFYVLFYNISIKTVTIVFKLLLVNILSKTYLNIVVILKTSWIPKLLCAPIFIVTSFPIHIFEPQY